MPDRFTALIEKYNPAQNIAVKKIRDWFNFNPRKAVNPYRIKGAKKIIS